jgi:Fic family protein
MAYYRLLQEVSTKENWDEWVLYILEGIEQTAEETLQLVKKINQVVENTAEDIKRTLPQIYSRELVELLFFEFYTKIPYIEAGLKVTRKTASGYLAELERNGFLESQKIGREKIFTNIRLYEVVREAGMEK